MVLASWDVENPLFQSPEGDGSSLCLEIRDCEPHLISNEHSVMIWKEFSRVPDFFYIYQTRLLL